MASSFSPAAKKAAEAYRKTMVLVPYRHPMSDADWLLQFPECEIVRQSVAPTDVDKEV